MHVSRGKIPSRVTSVPLHLCYTVVVANAVACWDVLVADVCRAPLAVVGRCAPVVSVPGVTVQS